MVFNISSRLFKIIDSLNLEGDQLAAQLVKRRLKEEAGEELDDEPSYEKVKIKIFTGSGSVLIGCGSGSTKFDECGSRSGSRPDLGQ